MDEAKLKEHQEMRKEREARKKIAAEAAARKATINRSKVIVTMQPSGLYTCSLDGGGNLPAELKGKFTDRRKVEEIVVRRYGTADHIKWQ